MSAPLILASASPRRRALLSAAGFAFEVHPARVEEQCEDDLEPPELVRELAARKALEVWSRFPEAWILGADTLVALGGEVLGKPCDREEAEAMLRALSGQQHEVFTAVALCGPEGSYEEFVERSRVTFRPLSDEELLSYLEEEAEWADKAGGYGIQGPAGAFVVSCEGSWSNVVGLPMERITPLLGRVLKAGSPLAQKPDGG